MLPLSRGNRVAPCSSEIKFLLGDLFPRFVSAHDREMTRIARF